MEPQVSAFGVALRCQINEKIPRGSNDSVSNMLPLLQVSPDASTQDKRLLLFSPEVLTIFTLLLLTSFLVSPQP